MCRLTEGSCKPLGLVIVDYGHTQSIEAHQTQNDPVEALSFHHAADEEPDSLLLTPEVGGAVHLTAAFHTGPTKRRAWRSCGAVMKRGERERVRVQRLNTCHGFTVFTVNDRNEKSVFLVFFLLL